MRAVDGKSVRPSPRVRSRLSVAVVWVLATSESSVATKRETIRASLRLDRGRHVHLLARGAFQKPALDRVSLRRGDDWRAGQGRVGGGRWNFLTLFALAAVPIETFRTIAPTTPLVAAVAELSSIVNCSFHIPGSKIGLNACQT